MDLLHRSEAAQGGTPPSRSASSPGDETMPSAHDVAVLQAHPRFAEAVHTMMHGIVAVYQGNRVLNQVMNDRGRAIFGMLAIYLHFSSDDGQPSLSAARMKALCTETGLCSAGRATAMLLLMRYAGYLVPGPHGSDRRMRPLVPTELMLNSQRERLACHFRAMSLLMPEGKSGLANLYREDFLSALARRFGASFRAGFRFLDSSPALYPLAERNAGMMILFSLFLASEPQAPIPQPFTLSVSALSRRFSISRPHVLNVLRDAERLGFVARTGDGDELLAVCPPLSAALNDFAATVFLYLAQCVRHSLDETG